MVMDAPTMSPVVQSIIYSTDVVSLYNQNNITMAISYMLDITNKYLEFELEIQDENNISGNYIIELYDPVYVNITIEIDSQNTNVFSSGNRTISDEIISSENPRTISVQINLSDDEITSIISGDINGIISVDSYYQKVVGDSQIISRFSKIIDLVIQISTKFLFFSFDFRVVKVLFRYKKI